MRVRVLWIRVRVAIETPKGYPCNSLDTLMAHSTDTLARSNTAIYDNNASQSDKKKDAKIPIKIMTVVQYFIGEYDLLRV